MSTAGGGPADIERDWEALREAGEIQFAPVQPPAPAEMPGWYRALSEFFADLFRPVGEMFGSAWPVIQNVLIALGVLLALIVLWAIVRPFIERWRLREAAGETEWTPDRGAAVALLEDADRLAKEGKFEEAVHLLLQRSVNQIAEARPDWLHPASTAREIAAFPMLPEGARRAFAVIAERVERGFFALRRLDADDWQAARSAYADFALAEIGA
ncbi:MAG: hypothetical protein R3D89_00165 [Sphingomonadaceae bacterium]